MRDKPVGVASLANAQNFEGLCRRYGISVLEPSAVGSQVGSDAVLLISNWADFVKTEAQQVYIGHGVGLSKGYPNRYVGDYCAIAPGLEYQFRSRGMLPTAGKFWKIGLYLMDDFFDMEQEIDSDVGLLFTYNWWAGGIYEIKPFLEYAERKGLRLAAKPHPFLWGTEFDKMLQRYANCQPWEEKMGVRTVLRSRVVLSDMSSMGLMAMAVGKPVVWYNSFDWGKADVGFDVPAVLDNDDILLRARKVSYQYSHWRELAMMLPYIIEEDPLKYERKMFVDELFKETLDGFVGQRLLAKCAEVASGKRYGGGV